MTRLVVSVADHTYQVELTLSPGSSDSLDVLVDGESVAVRFPDLANLDWLIIEEHPLEICLDGDYRWISSQKGIFSLEIKNMDQVQGYLKAGDSSIKAPIPGKITQVLVGEGETVSAGQLLVVLEAMKMENEIRSSSPGIVSRVHVVPEERVTQGQLLVEIDS